MTKKQIEPTEQELKELREGDRDKIVKEGRNGEKVVYERRDTNA